MMKHFGSNENWRIGRRIGLACILAAPAAAAIPIAVTGTARTPEEAAQPAAIVTAAPDQAFDCVVEPYQVIKLASSVVGVVGQLYVDRGARVRRGQVVGKLQNDVEVANLALARAKAADEYGAGAIRAHLDFLKVRQSRVDELSARNIVTHAVRDEASADTRVAEQQLAGAQLNRQIASLAVRQAQSLIEQKTLRSPINGVVTEVLLRPGEYRNEQSAIMNLAQIDPLRVEVFVPTRYYGKIRPRMMASVVPEAPVGGVHRAQVTVVDEVIDAASGTFGVRLLMPNPTHQVPAGLQCKVRFS